jgi:hypothetical protein
MSLPAVNTLPSEHYVSYVIWCEHLVEMVQYFVQAGVLLRQTSVPHPSPSRTFSISQTAFHLNRDPFMTRTPINEVAERFHLPDLRAALGDFILRTRNANSSHITNIGGHRISSNVCPLSFTHLEVWMNFHLQTKGYHYPHPTLPPKAVNAAPPSREWPVGRYDAVMLNSDPLQEWPHSGLKGKELNFLLAYLNMCLIDTFQKDIQSPNFALFSELSPPTRIYAPQRKTYFWPTFNGSTSCRKSTMQSMARMLYEANIRNHLRDYTLSDAHNEQANKLSEILYLFIKFASLYS